MAPVGRPPRYDWEDKRDICYKLYVEEKKSIAQVIKYFADHFNVAESDLPGEKNFSRQFCQKWNFPKRRQAPDKDVFEYLGQRMKEMWAQNMQMMDIREALANEGHVLSNYDFQKLKRVTGVRRRGETAFGPLDKIKAGGERDESAYIEGDATAQDEHGVEESASNRAITSTLAPEEAARRAQRVADQQAQSLERSQSRKRRRRTRDSGFAETQQPGEDVRYYSETSLDECKAFLGLDNDMYLAIRKQYETICHDLDFDRKKTALEDGRWQASLDRLVRENMHLSAVMHPLQSNQANKAMALDLICADVTKRIRDNKKQITIADANNILGLNPLDSKALRRTFYEILEADHYTTKLACGEEHWQELRQQWFDRAPFLQQVITQGDPQKVRCVQILCRDASKRYNDDQLRLNPDLRESRRIYHGPGPGAAKHKVRGKRKALQDAMTDESGQNDNDTSLVSDRPALGSTTTTPVRPAVSTNFPATFPFGATNSSGFDDQIDPTLAESNQYAPPPQTSPFTSPNRRRSRPQTTIPAYFRLSPASQVVGQHARMWLGKLAAPNMRSLHAAAVSKASAIMVKKVHGIIKNDDGTEDNYQIDVDEELGVYLEAAGEKPTFVVVLEGGYA